MSKMKLELEALAVESFETAAGGEERGTVRGHAGTLYPPGACTAGETCLDSCACGTRYPDYCPERTFELVPSCIDSCSNCPPTNELIASCEITC